MLFEAFKKMREERPFSAAFLVTSGDLALPITWKQFTDDIDIVVHLIRTYAPGAKFGLLGENSYEWMVAHAACLFSGAVAIPVDMNLTAVEIAERMHDADVLVFATPVYYYCVSGQLKTMLDRANPLFDSDYAFTKAYLLATAAEDGEETVEGTVKAVQGWVDCFERCELAGTVFAGGVNGVGDIAGHPALEEAYQMGKEI